MSITTIILTAVIVLLVLAAIGHFADRRADKGDPNVTPGLKLLPGDIEYKSQDGNTRIYFPIVTSIVVSVVLSIVLSLFR